MSPLDLDLTDLTTHLAAIGVGVVVALLLVGRFNKGGSSESPRALGIAAGDDGGPPAAAAAAKKKKKKRGKKKKGAGGPAPAAADDGAAAAPEGATADDSGKKKKGAAGPAPAAAAAAADDGAPAPEGAMADDSGDDDAAAPAPAPTPADGGKKPRKRNRKKKGAAAGAAAANGVANGASNVPAGGGAAPSPSPPVPPAPRAPSPPSVPSPSPPAPPAPAVAEEEEWEVIPKKKSKKKTAAAAARRRQQQAAANAAAGSGSSSSASTSVSFDASRVGIIIGPKGATMNAIQEKTGVKLDVNAPKPDEGSGNKRGNKKAPQACVVITEGTPEGRETARKAVLELAARGYATLLQAEGFGESGVNVHPRCLSEIVGPGGRTIKAVQEKLSVKLTIPKTDWTPKTVQLGNVEPSVRVGVAGDSPANVRQAKQVIKDLCSYHHHAITHPGMVHEEVYVPEEFYHCVIGPRGSEIKHIRGNYRVDVYMPSHESWCTTENVVCVGKPADVKKAVSYIQLLMDRNTEQRDQKYSDEQYGDGGW